MKFNHVALKSWRLERGVRTSDIAAALGISPGYYCDLESARKPGTAQLIKAAADFLKVPRLALMANPNDESASAKTTVPS